MNRSLSLGLLVAGILLIGYVFTGSDSVSPGFSRFFTGSLTDKAMFLLLAGVMVAIIGGSGLFGRSKAP